MILLLFLKRASFDTLGEFKIYYIESIKISNDCYEIVLKNETIPIYWLIKDIIKMEIIP